MKIHFLEPGFAVADAVAPEDGSHPHKFGFVHALANMDVTFALFGYRGFMLVFIPPRRLVVMAHEQAGFRRESQHFLDRAIELTRITTGEIRPGRTEVRHEQGIRAHNVHVHDGISEDEFVAMRTQRDATLDMPRLILPSVQINMRAGQKPPPEDNGQSYIKIPLDAL